MTVIEAPLETSVLAEFEVEVESDVTTLLRDAKTLLATRGWTQGAYTRDGAVCVLGAVFQAAYGGIAGWQGVGEDSPHVTRALDLLEAEIRPTLLVDWNDAYDRTYSEVRRVFELAIERSKQ